MEDIIDAGSELHLWPQLAFQYAQDRHGDKAGARAHFQVYLGTP